MLRYQLKSPALCDIEKLPPNHVGFSSDDDANLRVYCYNRGGFVAQWNNLSEFWQWPMDQCRGLVFKNEVLIARSFHKFHNLGTSNDADADGDQLCEWQPEYDDMQMTLLEKVDGSMILLFLDGNTVRAATKMGVCHEYEEWALEHWRAGNVYGLGDIDLRPGRTLVFEIIDERDEHVVPIDKTGLFFLGYTDLESDCYYPNIDNYYGRVEHVNAHTDIMRLHQSVDSFEGWVLLLHDGENVHHMFKLKSDYYLALRLQKKLRDGLAKDHELWRQYQIENDTVFYNTEYAIEHLGEFFDDWNSKYTSKIARTEKWLQAQYDTVAQIVQSQSWQRKDLAMSSQATGTLPLAMAIYDNDDGKISKVLNGMVAKGGFHEGAITETA